jgi:hypothetical protein
LRIDYTDLITGGKAVLRRCFEFLGEDDCERGTWALNVKINSSKASDRQSETDSRIRNKHDLQRAIELYEELRYDEVPAEPNLSALAQYRQGFEKSQGMSPRY